MTLTYALGTTYPPTAIDTLLQTTAKTGSRLPQDSFYEASQAMDRLDGHRQDIGLPTCTWRFAALSAAMLARLRTVCSGRSAAVYLVTRNGADTMTTYTAIMVWDEKMVNKRQLGNRYLDVEIEFRRLEVYVEPD